MNIFALHPDPAICASMHCDQHLHKMILESAQMLSTAARIRQLNSIESWLYKPTHEKHPCTLWTADSNHNMLWLCELCIELDNLRNSGTHSSMDIIHAVQDCIEEDFPYASHKHVDSWVFCGPDDIKLFSNLSVHQKYQLLYMRKYDDWLDKRSRMSYKNRPLPEFLSTFKDSIPHDSQQSFIASFY